MIMYARIESSLLEHGEDFNAYIDYRMKNVNACHASSSVRKRFHLLYFHMNIISANPHFQIIFWYPGKLPALQSYHFICRCFVM